jgi:ESCRT-II complex subunit
MASEAGGQRVEWVGAAKGKTSERCWVYWRRPEEWAGLIEAWVEGTGQKGTVLTLYELAEGDATRSQGILKRLLNRKLELITFRLSWYGLGASAKVIASLCQEREGCNVWTGRSIRHQILLKEYQLMTIASLAWTEMMESICQ